MMRVLIAFFLTFSIAFQGVANAFAFKEVIEAGASAHAVMAEEDAKSDGRCDLANMNTVAGMLCDDPLACELTPWFALVSARKGADPAHFLSPSGVRQALVPFPDPSRVWRPPLV